MDWIDLYGHFSYLFILVGMVLLSHRHSIGFVLRFIGELGWVTIGIVLGMTSIWSWGILFMLNDLYGFTKWKSNEDS